MKSEKYYIVGITGHRDLALSQREDNLMILKGHLLNLKRKHNDKKLLILTPLAEGADRLIAKAALDLHIIYDVILPMPEKLYCTDFSKNSQKEFLHYLKQARDVETLPLYKKNTLDLISKDSEHRNYQYREAGKAIVQRSDEMIIMSDGKDNHKTGGTSDITNYAKKCGKILYKIKCDRQCA